MGQILWVADTQLLAACALSALILALWWGAGRRRPWLFYPCLALAVTASVQLVGIYLVFASLILPALAVRGATGLRALLPAYLLGALAYLAGLLASARYDLPAGPLIVLALALAALSWGLASRRSKE